MAEQTTTVDGAPAATAATGGARFLLRTARETVTATGLWPGTVPLTGVDDAERALAELTGGTGAAEDAPAAVVGALPFAPDAAPHLVLPARWERRPATPYPAFPARPVPPRVGTPHPPGGPRWRHTFSSPDDAGFRKSVARTLELLAEGELRKVVLARALDYEADAPVDVAAVAARLAAREPDAHTFLLDVPGAGPRPPAVFLGASPELLMARRGRTVTTIPLAGSAPRQAGTAADRAAARALLDSAKDRYEHQVVVDDVVARLRPLCRLAPVPAAPSLVATGDLWHLGTRITGQLRDPAVNALRLARVLHPTPAVCGAPTAAAAEAIAAVEDFERGWYAGAVGWTDRHGDGVWAVGLRCALVTGRRARLYAGCGIVPGSQAATELAETTAKLRTVMAALGIDPGATP